jgi:hypothetical protein
MRLYITIESGTPQTHPYVIKVVSEIRGPFMQLAALLAMYCHTQY